MCHHFMFFYSSLFFGEQRDHFREMKIETIYEHGTSTSSYMRNPIFFNVCVCQYLINKNIFSAKENQRDLRKRERVIDNINLQDMKSRFLFFFCCLQTN